MDYSSRSHQVLLLSSMEQETKPTIHTGSTKLALCTAALLPELKPAHLFPVCYYWSNWLIQVCLTSVVTATIIRHTWINQVWPITADRKQGAGLSSGSSAAVHKANWAIEDWKNVAWSDESWFLLQNSDARARIWSKLYESMDPSCLVSTV